MYDIEKVIKTHSAFYAHVLRNMMSQLICAPMFISRASTQCPNKKLS